VIETQKDLKDRNGFDWLESTELAINKRKFLLIGLFVKQPIPQDEGYTYFDCYTVGLLSVQMYFKAISNMLFY